MKTRKVINFKIAEVEGEERRLRFVGSDDTNDRQGEILTLDGWDIKNYSKNPVFLWAHNYRDLPVGRAVSVELDKGLIFEIDFPSKEIYPFADTVFKMYKGGYLSAVSVGFIPLEYERSNDDKEPTKITRKELLELSAVPVPANPNALQDAMKSALTAGAINEQEYLEGLLQAKEYIEREINAAGEGHILKPGEKVVFNNTAPAGVIPKEQGIVAPASAPQAIQPAIEPEYIPEDIYKELLAIDFQTSPKEQEDIISGKTMAEFKNIFQKEEKK